MTGGGAGPAVEAAALPPADWNALLQADPDAEYSHTIHWHDAVAAAYPGAETLWLTVREEGRLVGGLGAIGRPAARWRDLARWESSLEGTSGGPLLAPDLPPGRAAAVVRALAGELRRRHRRWPWSLGVALGPGHERRFGAELAGAGPWRRHEIATAVIDLAGGADEVAARRMVMNKRNERNRGLKRGAAVTPSRAPGDLAAFYPLYATACVHWGQTPVPQTLLEGLLNDPDGRVFFTCVRLDDRVIGGHLNLHLGNRVFAWIGVTDPAFARSHFPATLCFWGDIVEACRRGARWLDVGASGGVNSLTGFKKYFGAELQTRGYYVSDGPLLGLLRRRRPGSIGGGDRWHDRRTGERRGGGPA